MTAATRPTDAEVGAWLALLSLPGYSPARLWDVRVTGDPTREVTAARRSGAAVDPDALLAAHRAAGVEVTVHGDGRHPDVATRDPHVPPVLLWRGTDGAAAMSGVGRIGIVGTRRATRYGVDLAHSYGLELARLGFSVVSGLASGIDAAAHRGALAAGDGAPVAVVGCGLDVPYPRSNRQLWADVASAGVVVSEYALGTEPAAWRFPARNRILAALCDALIVVESHERGGSLITAGLAGERGVPVLAVPGAVHSPASRGTNRLIADGCQPCLELDDVLTVLGWTSPRALPFGDAPASSELDPAAQVVLDALGWTPSSYDELAAACPGTTLDDLSIALANLVVAGRVAESGGRFEQVRR